MNKILVGVLTHNFENYIEECLRSVMMQTVECHLFVTDDGSTDSTVGLIKKWAMDVPPMFHQENSGTEQRGMQDIIDASYGFDYTFFISGDDVLHENAIEKLLARAKEKDADWTYGGMDIIDEKGELMARWPYTGFPESVESAVSMMYAKKCLCTTLCALFKGKFLEGKKMSQFPNTSFGIDTATALDWYTYNPIIARVDAQVVKYRQHMKSISLTLGAGNERAKMQHDLDEKIMRLFGGK